MTHQLNLRHGSITLPTYLPDATFGVVRSVDAVDLASVSVQALVMNTFHLMQHPGSAVVHSLGGLHHMSGWNQPIFTDSGGFQAYSLIHQNSRFGKISDKGLSFKPEGTSRPYQLSPEKCIQLQYAYGSDVLICLDDCTHVDAPLSEQQSSVKRTIAWAKRCKEEFLRLAEQKHLAEADRPHLFGVIQGGGERDLRKRCAEALLEIGFDGFGYGGWPLDNKGNLLTDMLGYTRELAPAQFPFHALGVGHPYNVAACFKLGYDLYDSAMPTRDARHGRLYTLNSATPDLLQTQPDWLDYLYIEDDRHIRADLPISPYCDCPVCKHYPLGYLRHLFKLNDTLYLRLATLHNLRFMTRLTENLGKLPGPLEITA